jgi:hypothetical protein
LPNNNVPRKEKPKNGRNDATKMLIAENRIILIKFVG